VVAFWVHRVQLLQAGREATAVQAKAAAVLVQEVFPAAAAVAVATLAAAAVVAVLPVPQVARVTIKAPAVAAAVAAFTLVVYQMVY